MSDDGDRSDDLRRIPRLDAGVTAALVSVSAGLATNSPLLLFLAVAGVVYAAYGYLPTVPEPTVEVERTVSDRSPVPGDDVAVTLTVRNVGDRTLPDLRVVDGVPEDLAVTDGSPRTCTALRPGEETVVEYAVGARRGAHEFTSTTVLSRSVSGTGERSTAVMTETNLHCRTALDAVPVGDQTIHYTGRVTTDVAGSGIEFHSTRAYQPGDPMNRIDWNRLARTGELTTVDYRQERAVTVVVVVDARPEAALAAAADEPDAVDLNAYAAHRAAMSLLEAGNRVGISVFGRRGDWLEPGAGEAHERRVRESIAAAPEAAGHRSTLHRDRRAVDGGRRRPSGDASFRTLREGMPSDAQALVVSGATDSFPVDVARELGVHGHDVTILSPDVTGTRTVGGRLAGLGRAATLSAARDRGARTVDWDPSEPLSLSIARAVEGWS